MVERHLIQDFSQKTEINHWDHIYSQQNFLGACYRQRMNKAISWLDASNLSKNPLILDAGCGAGVLTREIAKRKYKVCGLDYSSGMIERAKSICNTMGNLDVQFFQGDIQTLPFKDSSFDMITCLGVITYLGSEERALRELSRVLKTGGTLILSIVNRFHLPQYIDLPLFANWCWQKLLSRSVFRTNKSQGRTGLSPRSYFIPQVWRSLERENLVVQEYATVPLGLFTFCGYEVPPQKFNVKMTTLLNKTSNIPWVKSFGGMCLFRAEKSPVAQANHIEKSTGEDPCA